MTLPLQELTGLRLALAPMVATAQELRPEPRSEAAWHKWATEKFEAYERSGERPAPGEPPCWPQNPNRVHATRHTTLYLDEADKVREVYVADGVATLIRLPTRLAARGTRIAPGGEQRFKLLMGGEQILVTPTRQLEKGERFSVAVVLAEGTIIPLSLTRETYLNSQRNCPAMVTKAAEPSMAAKPGRPTDNQDAIAQLSHATFQRPNMATCRERT